MPLQKQYETQSGNSGDYWVCQQYDTVPGSPQEPQGFMECRYNLFKDAGTYSQGKMSMGIQQRVVLPLPSDDTLVGDIPNWVDVNAMLTKTSDDEGETPYFSDAEVV